MVHPGQQSIYDLIKQNVIPTHEHIKRKLHLNFKRRRIGE